MLSNISCARTLSNNFLAQGGQGLRKVAQGMSIGKQHVRKVFSNGARVRMDSKGVYEFCTGVDAMRCYSCVKLSALRVSQTDFFPGHLPGAHLGRCPRNITAPSPAKGHGARTAQGHYTTAEGPCAQDRLRSAQGSARRTEK
jgi:hypothetical protein